MGVKGKLIGVMFVCVCAFTAYAQTTSTYSLLVRICDMEMRKCKQKVFKSYDSLRECNYGILGLRMMIIQHILQNGGKGLETISIEAMCKKERSA